MLTALRNAGVGKAMLFGKKYFSRFAVIGVFAFGAAACASNNTPDQQVLVEQSVRFDAEIARHTSLRDENPEDLQILIQLSRSLRNAGRGEDAVATLKAAENAFRSDSEYLTELGNAHLVTGNATGARMALEAALAKDQNSWRAHAALGVAHDLGRRYADARNAYFSALNSCPNSAAILNNLALSESYSGQRAASMRHLNEAMEAQPNSVRIHRNWVVLRTLETRCADCDREEYAQLARSIVPQDWRGPTNELSCANQSPRNYAAMAPHNPLRSSQLEDQIESAENIAAGLDVNDYFDIRVWFEFDSAELTPNAYVALDELGEAINTNNLFDFGFRLEGHADASGTEGYNQNLSTRRAASVRDYLINSYRIDAHRLESIGFGESQLAAPNDPEGAINRRVRVMKLNRLAEIPFAGL
jgi:outer membrane protein OmpA-like peptidoglycan-associated protein/Flp pilus assembly protein TadD